MDKFVFSKILSWEKSHKIRQFIRRRPLGKIDWRTNPSEYKDGKANEKGRYRWKVWNTVWRFYKKTDKEDRNCPARQISVCFLRKGFHKEKGIVEDLVVTFSKVFSRRLVFGTVNLATDQ